MIEESLRFASVRGDYICGWRILLHSFLVQNPLDFACRSPRVRGILLFIWKLKEVMEMMENMKDKMDEWKDTWQDKNEDGRNW
ncbi:hypothetical protein CsSME_00047913 [Camellia sinensis var. sinensis]